MLTHQKRDMLILFRVNSFYPNLAFCLMSKVFVTVLAVKN